MKYLGLVILVLALVIGILPQFTECKTGMAVTTGTTTSMTNGMNSGMANGMNTGTSTGMNSGMATTMIVPMKCHWTAIAEIGMAIPLAALGGLLFFGKRKKSRRSLSILGAILGVFVVLFPTALIGVCASNMMACRNLMLPALVISGVLVVGACTALFASSFRMIEPVA